MKRIPRCVDHGKSAVIAHVTAEEVCRMIRTASGWPARARVLRRGRHTLVFTPQGTLELHQVTGYGQYHPGNACEIQYIFYGYYFMDDEGSTTTVVCHVLPLQSVHRDGSAAAVCAGGDTSAWRALEEQEKYFTQYGSSSNRDVTRNVPLNPLYSKYGPVRRVGFGHTHPGLHCFWSTTDRGSVFAAEGEPWVSLVVDPRNMEMLAGVGPDLTEPTTVLYEYHARLGAAAPERSAPRGSAPAEWEERVPDAPRWDGRVPGESRWDGRAPDAFRWDGRAPGEPNWEPLWYRVLLPCLLTSSLTSLFMLLVLLVLGV